MVWWCGGVVTGDHGARLEEQSCAYVNADPLFKEFHKHNRRRAGENKVKATKHLSNRTGDETSAAAAATTAAITAATAASTASAAAATASAPTSTASAPTSTAAPTLC